MPARTYGETPGADHRTRVRALAAVARQPARRDGLSRLHSPTGTHFTALAARRSEATTAAEAKERRPPGARHPALSLLTSIAWRAKVLLGCAAKQGSWTYLAALFKAHEIRTAQGFSEPPRSRMLRRFRCFRCFQMDSSKRG